ncbi:MAG TPA: hypothetical protein VF468_24425 [Actinomycetota bacterium]|nr:hypothetical protein [Actinomycetota bacterium]
MRYGPPFRYASRYMAERIPGARSGELPGTFDDRGAHRLKGVPDSWQLYAVELAGG